MAASSGSSDPRSSAAVGPLRRRRAENGRSTTIATLIAERASVGSADVALLGACSEPKVTWGDVGATAERWRDLFGGAFERSEVADLRVGLLTSSWTDFSREYLGALAAGVTVVPLDPARSEAELLWSRASFGLTHLMTDGGGLTTLRSVCSQGARARSNEKPLPVTLAGDFPLGLDAAPGALRGGGMGRAWHPSVAPVGMPFPPDTPLEPIAEIDHPALVIATKGSMGAPKLVPLSEDQLLAAAARAVDHFNLRPRDRGYVIAPLTGVDSQVVGLLAVLLSGGSVVIADGFDRRSFWAMVERTQVTWLNLVPSMVTSLAGVRGPDAVVRDRVRFARVSGGALPLATHSKFWKSTGVSLVETYTLTEAAGPVAANPLDLAGRRPGSAGLPVGVEVRILDDEGRLASFGTTGWIQVRGATVVTHYLSYGRNRSSLEARRMDGWLDTGDLGRRTRDGYLYLTGREVEPEAERDLEMAAGY